MRNDVLTAAQRSKCMSRIRCKDTYPELIVRSLLHCMGFRYRLHVPSLPGKPDIVFGKRKKVVFVHGCFWHVHRCKYGRVSPKTNAAFWFNKRRSNVIRDRVVRKALKQRGWKAMVIWECQTRDSLFLSMRLKKFLE